MILKDKGGRRGSKGISGDGGLPQANMGLSMTACHVLLTFFPNTKNNNQPAFIYHCSLSITALQERYIHFGRVTTILDNSIYNSSSNGRKTDNRTEQKAILTVDNVETQFSSNNSHQVSKQLRRMA